MSASISLNALVEASMPQGAPARPPFCSGVLLLALCIRIEGELEVWGNLLAPLTHTSLREAIERARTSATGELEIEMERAHLSLRDTYSQAVAEALPLRLVEEKV